MEVANQEISDIAYFCLDALGHVYSILGYLTELKRQGFNFDFYGPKNIGAKYFQGFATNVFSLINSEVSLEQEHPILAMELENCKYLIPKVEELWAKKKPKLIISDFLTYHGALLGKRNNIPVVSFYSVFFNLLETKNFKPEELIQFPPFPESRKSQIDEIEKLYGVKWENIGDLLADGDINISSIPEFFAKEFFPPKPNQIYIGPGFRDEDPQDSADFDIRRDAAGKKLVYVSLGTTPIDKGGFHVLDIIVEALKDSEYYVLISAGFGKAQELTSKGLPSNVVAKDFVPQMKVLQYASLFITHMGANGLLEALLNAVPMICFPHFADQVPNTILAEKLNVARWLKEATVESVKTTVDAVINDEEIRSNLKKYQAMIDPEASRKKFCEIVLGLSRKNDKPEDV